MAYGIQDRRGGRDQHMFPQTLGTKGTFRVWHLDQQAFDRRHVTNGGDQIVMQVFRPARDIFLHDRKADALGHPALDLPDVERARPQVRVAAPIGGE